MKKITEFIGPQHRVLDLAAGPRGSFPVPSGDVILIDRHADPHIPSAVFVRCDAQFLPFRDQAFDVVLAAHCLEHFIDPIATLTELKRVMKPASALYLSLPDASTLTDKLYRWLYLGGGHVNRFVNAGQVQGLVSTYAGQEVRSSRVLYSALHFMLPHKVRKLPRWHRYLFPGLPSVGLSFLLLLLSALDRVLHTRLTVYGWEMHFDRSGFFTEPVGGADDEYYLCSACGAGCSEGWLDHTSATVSFLGVRFGFRCPSCRALNFKRVKPRLGP